MVPRFLHLKLFFRNRGENKTILFLCYEQIFWRFRGFIYRRISK